jgi:hypothetical protein
MWHGHPHHGTRFRWSQHIPTNDEQCAPRKKRRNCCVWWLTESSMASLSSKNKKSHMNSNRRRRYVSWGVWPTRYPNNDCVRLYQMRIHTKISKRSSYEIMMIYECCRPKLFSMPTQPWKIPHMGESNGSVEKQIIQIWWCIDPETGCST